MGGNAFGQLSVPSGLTNVKAIAAGTNHSLAVKQDGSVVAWGWNTAGQTNVPTTLPPTSLVAVGFDHSMALTQMTPPQSFGSVATGSISVPKTFTIRNTTVDTLTIFSVSVSGGQASDFIVNTTGMAGSLNGISPATTFSVTFQPSAAGVRGTTLRILSNDADEGTVEIPLTGNGLAAPEISVFAGNSTATADERTDNLGTVVLPSTPVGVARSHTFTIKNIGSVALNGLALNKTGANASELTYDPLGSSSLAPNESLTFLVAFTPTAVGYRSATLASASNDADENPFEINLSINDGLPELSSKDRIPHLPD